VREEEREREEREIERLRKWVKVRVCGRMM
jgi:hypothetical protein